MGSFAFRCRSCPTPRVNGRADDRAVLIAVVYIGLVALVQQDMKKLVAYSSMAHMGFVTLGFFVFDHFGVSGRHRADDLARLCLRRHVLVHRRAVRPGALARDRRYGGVVNTMPQFTMFAVLFAMANCGLPGTAGFVGEWMVILGVVKVNFWLGLAAASTLVFGAAYTLWMVKRVYFGDVANDDVKALTDINRREYTMLAVMAIAVLWMGLYPKPITDAMDPSVAKLLKQVAASKL
jgi:NADH-quinone oxidoreductase subunit M